LHTGSELSVWGDEDKLHQVVTNLVDNAIKYTPQKGSIRIEIGSEVPTVGRLSVIDSGEGIPATAQSKLFDLFYRVDNLQREYTKGFGVGLSIVKTFVELHGGRVVVESEEGKGTAFHVMLPLSPQETGRSEVKPIKVQRILLVDDDPDIRQFVTERLERAGYSVHVAGTGRQALAMIASGQFDGLVLDIGLPELNGIEVLRSVRSQHLTMPVLIITAAEGRDEAMRAVEGGAQAYLLKPFIAGQFERVVAQCFERGFSHDAQVA
jgi:CheY-like chemotaxis protein